MAKQHKAFAEHLQDLKLQFTKQANETIQRNYKDYWASLFSNSFNDTGFHHDTIVSSVCNMRTNYDNTRIEILKKYFDDRMNCSQCTKKIQCAMLSHSREYISIPLDIKYKKFHTIITQLDITDYYGICLAAQDRSNDSSFNSMHNIKPKEVYL